MEHGLIDKSQFVSSYVYNTQPVIAFCLAPGLACIAIAIVPSLTLVTGPGGVSGGFGLLLL